jgi:hypothetical protein
MATITTDTYLDGGTARTAGETWTMNGGVLTIRTDTRVHANAPASFNGSIGATTISATLGGGVLIDGRNVREVWFDSGTGTVPAIGTTVSQGGVEGYLLGVWANLNSLPTAVGAAMPTSGFIKFREVTGGSFAAGALTGIGANALGADVPSWIEVVQRQSVANTVPRLGFFRTRGTWYTLPQTTSGTAGQIIQTPSMGSAGSEVPCIWIETGVGTNVYEAYPAMTSTYFIAANLATDARAKFVQTIGSGQVRIGNNGTVDVGYTPPAGCRIRIPNVIGRQSLSGSDNLNQVPSTTIANRPDFTTTSAGVIDFEYFLNDWYHLFASPNNVKMKYVATFDAHSTSNEASPTELLDYHIGSYLATSVVALTFLNNPLGGTITNSKFFRGAAASNGHAASVTACLGYAFDNCQFGVVQYARSTGRSILFNQSADCTLNDIYQFNAYVGLTTSFRMRFTGLDHTDRLFGNTNATTGLYVISATTSCDNIFVDGVTFGLKGTLSGYFYPYAGVFNAANSSNITFRNAGTRTNPLACESNTLAPAYVYLDSGVNSGVKVQRCYLTNTRTSAYLTVNTTKDLTIESVHGTIGALQTLSLNTLVKGARATSNSTTGGASVYGTHVFDAFFSDTDGRIWFAMNEPTAATASYVALTLAGSTGGFTSGGQVAMPTVGDQLVIEMPYYALGHTAFQNTAPTLTGTNTGNFSFEYAIDTGSGFGSYKTLNASNLSGETLNPAQGVKLRLRITTTTANTGNAITYVRVDTSSTLAAQTDNLYPLDTATIAISGLRAGSRVQIYDTTNDAELFNAVVAGTSLSYAAPFTSSYTARIRVMYATALTADEFVEFSDTVTASGLSRSVTPTVDPVYVANAVDGFSVTGITIDDAALLLEADDGTYSWADIYAYETAWLFSEEGIRDEGRFITAIDPANYLLENFKIKNVSSPTAPLILVDGWGRDSVTNQTIDIIDTTGGSIFSNPDLVISYATGSGLSPSEQATLEKINTLTEDSGGIRFTAKALEEAPAGGGGSGDWTSTEKNQIRYRLGIDGTTATPSASPQLNVPTASANASAVRTELTTELGRIDVATSTRLATAGYTTPPTAAAIRSEIDTSSTKLDVAVGTRLASASYVAPANSDITAIKAKTDNLPSDPADESSIQAAIAAIPTAPSASTVASAVRTELTTELGRIDVATSTRLAAVDYTAAPTASANATAVRSELATELARIDVATSTRNAIAPLDSTATQAAAAAALNAYDPPTKAELDSAEADIIAALPAAAPSASTVASAVRTELTTELGRIDVATSTRLAGASYTAPANADISAIKAKTDNLPSDPADESSIQAAIAAIPTAPSASTVASAVRTELTTELGRIDANISSRATPTNITDARDAVQADIAALNDLSAADVKAEADQALVDYDAPTKAELDSATSDIQDDIAAVKTNTDLIPGAL